MYYGEIRLSTERITQERPSLLLLTAYNLLPSAYCSLLTTNCSLLPFYY